MTLARMNEPKTGAEVGIYLSKNDLQMTFRVEYFYF